MKPLLRGEFTTRKSDKKLKGEFTKRFAIYLKKARKAKGFSQEQLAFKAGLNPAYISHIERAKYSVSLFVAWKISQALDSTLPEFLTDL
jgi:transcriptional regulator with XRE-family HTH domain